MYRFDSLKLPASADFHVHYRDGDIYGSCHTQNPTRERRYGLCDALSN